MVQKANPMVLTDSLSDCISDFSAFRFTRRKVDSKKEIFLEIEFWNGGRLSGTISHSNLMKIKAQINKILKGKSNVKVQENEIRSEEDFIEILEDIVL